MNLDRARRDQELARVDVAAQAAGAPQRAGSASVFPQAGSVGARMSCGLPGATIRASTRVFVSNRKKERIVSTRRIGIAAVAAVATAALAASVASAGPSAKTIAFSATYKGKAVVKVTDDVADISANGTGTGKVIGAGKIAGKGKGDASARPCVPFTGLGTMTGAGGTKLTFKVVSGTKGCGDEEGQLFSISGRATVVSATGKLAKAKGSLKLTGLYNRGAGTFSVKFTGTLKK